MPANSNNPILMIKKEIPLVRKLVKASVGTVYKLESPNWLFVYLCKFCRDHEGKYLYSSLVDYFL